MSVVFGLVESGYQQDQVEEEDEWERQRSSNLFLFFALEA